jgi:hypothetical protein
MCKGCDPSFEAEIISLKKNKNKLWSLTFNKPNVKRQIEIRKNIYKE